MMAQAFAISIIRLTGIAVYFLSYSITSLRYNPRKKLQYEAATLETISNTREALEQSND
jgi:NADH:ubiquinone oxidoreductase subunit 3 (subunit A)